MRSSRSRRPLVLVSLVALIAGAIWWSELEGSEAPAGSASMPAATEVEQRRGAPSMPALEFDDTRGVESERQVAPQRAAAATRTSDTARVTLVAEVWKYLDAVQGAELQVVALNREVQQPPTATTAHSVKRGPSAARLHDGSVVGRTDSQGRVELDVTKLFRSASDWKPHTLALRVVSTDEQVDEFEVALSSEDRARALVEPLRCEVRLELACDCKVQASVRTADDEFAQTELHYFKVVGSASEKASATSARPSEGALRLVRSFECGREYVAVASSKGYATQTVWFRGAPVVDLGEIVLERGAVLAGRVRVGLQGVRGVVQAERVDEGAGRAFGVDGETYQWRRGDLVLMRASASSDDDGAFRIEGLAPELYRLTLRSPHMGLTSPVTVGEAVAPATELELHLNSAIVDVRVTRAGRPLPSASIAVIQSTPKGNTAWVVITDEEGRACVWVHGDYSTRVGISWRETPQSAPIRHEQSLDFPGAGERREVRIDL